MYKEKRTAATAEGNGAAVGATKSKGNGAQKSALARGAAAAMVFLLALSVAGCLSCPQTDAEDDAMAEITGMDTECISRLLGADISRGVPVSEYESHGGFHGDGTTFIEVVFFDDGILEDIEESGLWKPLPVGEGVAGMLDAERDDDWKRLVPEVEKGYYFFLDRHSESVDRRDDSQLMKRYSINATAAVYDSDARVLYYLAIDT